VADTAANAQMVDEISEVFGTALHLALTQAAVGHTTVPATTPSGTTTP
jgi:hypothetical protein